MLSLCSQFTDIRNLNWIPNESFDQMWPEKSVTLLGFYIHFGSFYDIAIIIHSGLSQWLISKPHSCHCHGLMCDYISLSTPLSYPGSVRESLWCPSSSFPMAGCSFCCDIRDASMQWMVVGTKSRKWCGKGCTVLPPLQWSIILVLIGKRECFGKKEFIFKLLFPIMWLSGTGRHTCPSITSHLIVSCSEPTSSFWLKLTLVSSVQKR